LIAKASIEIVPVDAEQAQIARSAFSQFGKGRHPAGLNYGDCFSYGLAKTLGQPLLYKGKDFAQTDIEGFAQSADQQSPADPHRGVMKKGSDQKG
jgi:ribonuclease VapC